MYSIGTMRQDKQKAISLRRQGNSYNNISAKLNIPKSTISSWVSTQPWSQAVKDKLKIKANAIGKINLLTLSKIRKDNLAKLYAQATSEAVMEFKNLQYHPLFITGLSLYWGEGNKSLKGPVNVVNTDAEMIKIFYMFLLHICGTPNEKIKAYITIYPDNNEVACRKYWLAKTGLKDYNFTKSVVIQGKHHTRRLHYGICNLGVPSTYLKTKMLVWLNLLAKECTDNKYFPRV